MADVKEVRGGKRRSDGIFKQQAGKEGKGGGKDLGKGGAFSDPARRSAPPTLMKGKEEKNSSSPCKGRKIGWRKRNPYGEGGRSFRLTSEK